MSRVLLIGCVVLLVMEFARAGDRITQADLIRRIIDLDRLTAPPPPGERVGNFSSTGKPARTTPEGWDVLAEIKKPGAITRLWVDQPAGTLRIVLDGQKVIEAPMGDLFNGRLEPFGKPLTYATYVNASERGMNCYFPIGFAKSCEIQSRNFSGACQVDFTTFDGAQVERFKSELSDNAQAALEEVVEALDDGLSDEALFGDYRVGPFAAQEDVARNKKISLEIERPGTIRALMVSLTDRTDPRVLHALHNCTLRIFWDGHEEPDVEVPLAEFFGTGFDRNTYDSLVMGTNLWTMMPGQFDGESRFMFCYFPMPFKTARVEIENHNRRKIGFMLFLQVDRDAPAADSLRFKARYHVEDPCESAEFVALQTAGHGRLVGCALHIDNPRKAWWGAGKHKISIDGEKSPSILGTGTADFFGSVRGLPAWSGPLNGVTLSAPYGRNSAYRWQINDAANFQRSIRLAFENVQDDQANDVYYASVAYWYGEPEAKSSFAALGTEQRALPGMRLPGAVEIENNILSKGWGNILKQKHLRGRAELSGQAAATITSEEPLQVRIPVDTAGRYRLKLRVMPGRSFKQVDVRTADGKPIGTVNYTRRPDGLFPVGEADFEQGDNTVIIRCAGNPVLDCWVLERVEE